MELWNMIIKTDGTTVHLKLGIYALHPDYFQLIEKQIREQWEG